MEQIKQILSQLALHLELNIAMCDKIDSIDKRLTKLESSHDALKVKNDSLSTRVSELFYSMGEKAYNARHGVK